jgi:hypothetical protein
MVTPLPECLSDGKDRIPVLDRGNLLTLFQIQDFLNRVIPVAEPVHFWTRALVNPGLGGGPRGICPHPNCSCREGIPDAHKCEVKHDGEPSGAGLPHAAILCATRASSSPMPEEAPVISTDLLRKKWMGPARFLVHERYGSTGGFGARARRPRPRCWEVIVSRIVNALFDFRGSVYRSIANLDGLCSSFNALALLSGINGSVARVATDGPHATPPGGCSLFFHDVH